MTATKNQPARKAAPPRKRVPAKAPAESVKDAQAAATPKTIIVEGRTIPVKIPTIEQLMAWESTMTQISKMTEGGVEYEQIRAHIDRFYKISAGLFVNDVDKEWLHDGRLDGTISIDKESVLNIVGSVTEVYEDEIKAMKGNREAGTLEAGGFNRATRRATARKKT